MRFKVMNLAEPSHLKRLAVVLMMPLDLLAPADLAGLANDLP
jgi:hypothetical protein